MSPDAEEPNVPVAPNGVLLPVTAQITPQSFPEQLSFVNNSRVIVAAVVLILVAGFAFRVNQLGYESLGEDELNKLQTVREYRENGLSGKNGEHPFLMKGLQTVSISLTERFNSLSITTPVSQEAALRFPITLFGTFTALLLFLLVSQLFGRSIGLVTSALWAVEPMAIGFDRIAKEDSLVLFFFLLTNFLWIKSQSVAERGHPDWFRYSLGAAAAFAALMASKYYPHLLAISGAYYNVFKHIPGKLWNLRTKRWLTFAAVMGLSFLILNPTIMLPDTWREMLKFSSENRIGHDSYEFWGNLYPNKMTAWLSGVPWTFYYVFIGVKTSLVVLIFAAIGLPLMFRRRMGDGRYFIFFWAFMWFLPFTFLGGKFTRYFTFVEPLLLILAATAFCYAARELTKYLGASRGSAALQSAVVIAFLAFPIFNSLSVTPHYRLFTNTIGGGMSAAGTYFPHDEFYDLASKKLVENVAAQSGPNTVIACETPGLFEYYANSVGREDLQFVSLSNVADVRGLKPGDAVVIASGRRYFSNKRYADYLEANSQPSVNIDVLGISSAKIYKLDARLIAGLNGL